MIGELWAFALIMLIGQFSPGPDMLLLTRTSLAEGLRSGWMMVLGISTGLTLHASLAIGGIAVVVSQGRGHRDGIRGARGPIPSLVSVRVA